MHPFIYLSVMVIMNICWYLSAMHHAKCSKIIFSWQIYEVECCEWCFCSRRHFFILLFLVPLGNFSLTSRGLGGCVHHSDLIRVLPFPGHCNILKNWVCVTSTVQSFSWALMLGERGPLFWITHYTNVDLRLPVAIFSAARRSPVYNRNEAST